MDKKSYKVVARVARSLVLKQRATTGAENCLALKEGQS